MTRIAVIDHGAGNLVSVARALERQGAEVDVVTERSALATCDGVVLPGVGTTRAAMDRLEAQGLVEPLRAWDGPLLGICVGLQLLFDTSEEDDTPCLGFIDGRVSELSAAPLLPHIGWNDVELAPDPLFAGLDCSTLFYFVHSYAPVPDHAGDAIGWSDYGDRFVAAARRGNRVGVQFHPERSGAAGLSVLGNFIAECGRSCRAA